MEKRLFAYGHHNGRVAAVVEVECETDFCANTEEFKTFGSRVAMLVASGCSTEALIEEIPPIRELLKEKIQIGNRHAFKI